jgi:RNA-directed DNA polymerase
MAVWRPQHFRQEGQRRGIPSDILKRAVQTGNQIAKVHRDLPPVFSLRHLAHLTNVDYGFLRAVVSRDVSDPYTVFRIAKSIGEPKKNSFRVICVPNPSLMLVQRWIANCILSLATPHAASFAYARATSIKDAAHLHCNHPWLIKLDVRRFFESISEISAYRAFRNLGFQPLISFEMARLCTRLGGQTLYRRRQRWFSNYNDASVIKKYNHRRIGHLPQGAPTSPMLSNLAMFNFDVDVTAIAERFGLVYTRYADDLCLSTDDRLFSRNRAGHVIGAVYGAMQRVGLSPNVSKTHLSPPGSRKIVLGLLVDNRQEPGLSREFRACLRQHIYYLTQPDIGAAKHAKKRKFASVVGLRHHIEGLIAFARGIDPAFAASCEDKLSMVQWPI